VLAYVRLDYVVICWDWVGHFGTGPNISILIFIKGKGEVVPVLFLTEHRAVKAYWGSGGIAPGILDLGTRWR
jgi:hypothetical protein